MSWRPVPISALDRKDAYKRLDDLCREVTFRRDGFRCQRCSKGMGLQWHHVITRGFKGLRWDPDNCLALCAGCHRFWWHMNPGRGLEWFQQKWPQRWERVHLRSLMVRLKVDLVAVELALTLRLDEDNERGVG